jgi:hypothetical protein
MIAIAVGCAEGTRTKDGGKTKAWYKHKDLGNGAQNQGSFSYQHPAGSPEFADRDQIRKLKNVLLPAFLTAGLIDRTQFAIACDVYTQSELACLGDGGFLEQIQKKPNDLIGARVRAYCDPNTGRLDAPGFGNDIVRLQDDQIRRTKVVLDAISIRL